MAGFGVPELWIWRRDALKVFVFDPGKGEYRGVDSSVVLDGIDLAAVADCARMDCTSAAVAEFERRCGL